MLKGKHSQYVFDDRALEEMKKTMTGKDFSVQRFKGLGEMNPEELWETTMDPAHRTMLQVKLEDENRLYAGEIFNILMGEKVEPRREFITANARYVQNLDI